MRRRPLNFIASVVTPIIMLALVNPFVFIIPFNSGERTSYSITVLLAFTVYMTVVSDRMPASSDPICQLSFYLLLMLAISVLIVIINIFQIRTYEKEDSKESIPQWLRSVVLFLRKNYRPRQVGPTDQNKVSYDSEQIVDLEKQNTLHLDPVGADDQMLETSLEGNKTASAQQEAITWYTVAKATDKLYFTAFLVITVVSSLGYFLSVTT
ncbi:Acetylcholine receptor subunit alpha [Mizuhopecten yessoensis]|uniref:Acetylcholine receptor subunit alpha n=1 Tax=Mizuhopecten yessoensis TaxID=6573 RepID=A0A210R0D0_MIZYE|nr:Acetylcholine receptor subunit alpha [Mizuhopecten yessoensis]